MNKIASLFGFLFWSEIHLIEREEEAKLERRIQEQQDRMKREFDEEQAKKRAKEQAVSNRLLTHTSA